MRINDVSPAATGRSNLNYFMISNNIRQTREKQTTCLVFDQSIRKTPAPGPVRCPGRGRGFTLIELLVVLGIIAVVVGTVGLALRGGDETVALSNAQRTVASLLTATRAQAIMNGTNARLIIHNDPNEPDRYLRYVGIVREQLQPDGLPYLPRRWVPTNEGTRLPRGVYFVPQVTSPMPQGLFTDDWTAQDRDHRVSVYKARNSDQGDDTATFALNPEFPRTLSGQNYSEQQAGSQWIFYQFGPRGQLRGDDGSIAGGLAPENSRIVLTTGRRTPTTPELNNPTNLRGVILRPLGVFHLVHEAESFRVTP